jgi:ribosome-binding protein aMBF1 (putative translation factor)
MKTPKRPSTTDLDDALREAETAATAEVTEMFARLRRKVAEMAEVQSDYDAILDSAKAQRDESQQLADRLQCELNELRASMGCTHPGSSPVHLG